MGEEGLAASVFDASALIAIERRDAWIRGFLRTRLGPIFVPAPVLARAWRDGARQASLARFLAAKGTVVETLDELSARAIGTILGQSGTTDVVDASVVLAARRHRALVLTGDAEDLRRIDPDLVIEEL